MVSGRISSVARYAERASWTAPPGVDAMRDIPLLGSLPRQTEALPERHLGLVLPNEVTQIEIILDKLAEQLSIDMAAWETLPMTSFESIETLPSAPKLLQGKIIAIAQDAAFAFIYPANLACLRELGAELIFFSPLANDAVPKQADAVYLPGGYPELHAQALRDATLWQESIRTAHTAGIPILAECGGMMALTESVTDQQNVSWNMVGLIPGQVIMQQRLAALGAQALNTVQGELRGHSWDVS